MIGRETKWGGFAPAFVVNPEVADEVFKYSWVSVSGGRYLAAGIAGKMVMLHRYVFFLTHGYCPKIVDHINRNRYDNRIENLRAADPSLSNLNRNHRRGKYPPGVSKPKWGGVNRTLPFQATKSRSINGKRKTVSLGYYATVDEASLAVANFVLNELVFQ